MTDVDLAELISKVAHELRSPLTSLKGFSATLLKRWDQFDEEQRRQFVETIHADAERMGRIVSEVLDLARMEAGRLELNPSEINLAAVVERAVDNVSRLDGAARVRVVLDPELSVWADLGRLETVFTNLVENGIKYSDEGPVNITAADDGGTVSVVVRDEGVGIEPDHLAGVFDGPAPKAGRAAPSGTGLGLYISKRLIEALGGAIEVTSRPGTGSTFTVRLPRAEVTR